MGERLREHRWGPVLLGWGIVVAGLGLGWLVGGRHPPATRHLPESARSLALPRRLQTPMGQSTGPAPGEIASDRRGCGGSRPTVSIRSDTGVDEAVPTQPPSLARSFPAIGHPPAASAYRLSDPTARAQAPNLSQTATHKVVNGDSLAGLAARYLGDASRAGEIFEANRDRLHSPDLLPIGLELRIPLSRPTEHHETANTPASSGLVPIQRPRPRS